MSGSLPSRLPHASGANVDNPKPAYRVEVSFDNGQWYVCEIKPGAYGFDRGRLIEVDRKVAVALAIALGYVQPDVIDSNYAMWLEAALAWQIEHHRRATQSREASLCEARKALARAKARTA